MLKMCQQLRNLTKLFTKFNFICKIVSEASKLSFGKNNSHQNNTYNNLSTFTVNRKLIILTIALLSSK